MESLQDLASCNRRGQKSDVKTSWGTVEKECDAASRRDSNHAYVVNNVDRLQSILVQRHTVWLRRQREDGGEERRGAEE